jgi:hypothetical protein
MPRNLTTDFKNALSSNSMNIRFLFSWELQSSTVRLCSGNTDLAWDSQAYLGNSYFAGLSNLSNSSDFNVNDMQVQLSAAPAIISSLLSNLKHGGLGTLRLALLDSSHQIIDDPIILFAGELDKAITNTGSTNAYAQLSFLSSAIRLRRKRELRINNVAQQNRHSGDKGFEFVEGLSKKKIWWGLSGEGVP